MRRTTVLVATGAVLTAAGVATWPALQQRELTTEPTPLAASSLPSLVDNQGGTEWAALRTCDHETPAGVTEGGCGVLDRVHNGSEVTMWCWRSTAAPKGYPSAKWFYVTTGKVSPHPGWSGWMYSDFVTRQTQTPACDSAILAAHPLPAEKPLVFKVLDGCTGDGKGEMTAETANFKPGRAWEVYVGETGSGWEFSRVSGTVASDGRFTWRIPCNGESDAASLEWSVTDHGSDRVISEPYDITFVKNIATKPPTPRPPTPTPPGPAQDPRPVPPSPGNPAPPADTGTPRPPAPAPVPVPSPPTSRTLTVQNMVTNGPTQLREDTPAYLSSVMRNFCKRDNCSLPGTDVGTGARINAICQATGVRTTNGNDGDPSDDTNPGRYESTLWYGVKWADGRFGYISEVWISPSDRGGLGLPTC